MALVNDWDMLAEHGLKNIIPVTSLPSALATPREEGLGTVTLAVLGIEHGFETDSYILIGEQDILGDRLIRRRRKRKSADALLNEIASLTAGDLVVHVDHGIGRFIGLGAIAAAGAPHDCLEIHYAGGDKLYLPVENIELLTRYGGEDTEAQLDRLGGAGWQTRKARMKKSHPRNGKGVDCHSCAKTITQSA